MAKTKATNRISDNGATTTVTKENVVITPLTWRYATFTITGTSIMVQNKFSARAQDEMERKQAAGDAGKNTSKKRTAKDFKRLYEESMHRGENGEYAIPCTALRNAMIKACSVAGFHMTKASMCIFVEPDGRDREGHGLTFITHGKPSMLKAHSRNASGVIDIRARAKFEAGWRADVTVKFDPDQFTTESVVNLLGRAGEQVGIQEGRPSSKKSFGMQWGTFRVMTSDEVSALSKAGKTAAKRTP